MVTTNSEWTLVISGLSTDHKPLLAKKSNGSIFIELDTGNKYVYSYDNKKWTLITGTLPINIGGLSRW